LPTAICYDTYTHIKTTIEISDSLLDEAKRLAAKEGTTVRAYVEQGLRRILSERKSRGQFRLRKATFKGKGLQPGVQDATWERIREAIYQGRGG
jgi:Arc/MetJ family transcription regulator